MSKILVGIIMGSDSDLPIMQEACDILKTFDIAYEVRIISAHRTPDTAHAYASTAVSRGIEVIIAGAGGAAHLAGILAAYTPLPIVGVPIQSPTLGGLDSLLSISQMPGGVPVATMTIGKPGAKNAGLFAAQILGVKYPAIQQRMLAYKKEMADAVDKKDKNIQEN
jgi:phosphoribosylaminoimidazole carboxylase PurE protein